MRRPKFRLARIASVVVAVVAIAVTVAANRDQVVQAQRLERVPVIVTVDGTRVVSNTTQATVGDVLKESGIKVGPQDVVTPALTDRPYFGMNVTVTRIEETIEELSVPMSFNTVRTFSSSLRPGIEITKKPGKSGEKLVRCRFRYADGKIAGCEVLDSQVVRKPESRVLVVGSRGAYTSRGSYGTRRVLRMSASAYDPGPRSCGRRATGRTSCGMRAGYGVVAVDPRVIRLGSKLYVEGYGFAIAGDVGSSIKGPRIDLGFGSYREAIRYGRKKVKVHVLKDQPER